MKKKTTFKRVLAGMMGAAVMASSLFSANVFAADEAGVALQTEKQIVTEQVSESYADGRVNITKSVVPTGVENEFEVTVEVETTETIQEITSSPDAAVVLVLDVSNSMKGDALDDAKNAARDFIDDYVKEAGDAKRMLSIVQFGSNALTTMGWTDVKGASDAAKNVITNDVKIGFTYSNNGCTYYGCSLTDASHTHNVWSQGADWERTKNNWVGEDEYTCTVCGVKDTAYSRNDCERHQHNKSFWESHNVTDGGGTNIEGGLRLANNLLADSAVSDIETTYVIMMTDGLPSFYVSNNDTTTSTTFMQGSRGCGNPYGHCQTSNDYTDIPGVIDSIQETAKMYVVGCELEGKINNVDVQKWFTDANYAGVDQYFDAAQSSQLSQYFKNIAAIIKNAAQAWIMEDPMGSSIDYIEGVSVNMQGTTATESDDSITWNLKDDATFTTNTVGDTTTYTYTMTYKVKLDTTSEAFKADEDGIVPTNGTIELTYMVTGENGEIDPELKTATFDKSPMVKGYLGEKVEFMKVDSRTGNALEGAEFTLFRGDEAVATATSDADGKVIFTDIPSGFDYTIKETVTPEGYNSDNEIFTVSVAYGVVTALAADGSPLVTVKNSPDLYEVSYEFVGSAPADAVLPETEEYAAGETVAVAGAPETAETAFTWEFTGWFMNKECTTKAEDFPMPAEDVTIYGKWIVRPATFEPAAAAYITEYYFEATPNGDDYVIDDSKTTVAFAPIGETVGAEIKEFAKFIPNLEWEESVLTGEVVLPSDEVPVLTLKVYYEIPTADPKPLDPIKAAYIIKHYYEQNVGEGDYAIDDTKTLFAFETVGTVINAEPQPGTAYTYNTELSTASGAVVMPSASEDGGVKILTLELYYDLIPSTPIVPAAAAYKVEYYFEKTVGEGDYELNTEKSYTRTAPLDAEVTPDELTVNGYVLNKELSDASGIVVMPEASEDGAPVILTLKVYFDLIPSTPIVPAAAAYKVEYYFEKTVGEGDYELDTENSYIRTAALGSEVTPDELTVNGYVLNKELSDASGIVVMPEAGEDGAPVILTLKVYFDLIPSTPLDPVAAAYITEYYLETEDGVYEIKEGETEKDFAPIGDTVNAEIKEFEGYVHNAEWEESILSGEVVMPSMSETQELEILTLKVYYDIAESTVHGGFKVVKGDGEYEVSETFMFELYGVVDGAKTEVPVAVSRVNVSKVFEQERGFDIWFFNVPLKGYDSFILQEVAGESEDWTYDTTEYAVSLVETEAGYALMTEDGSYVNILNTYTAPEEPTPPPSEPEEEEPTIIRIVKTWVGGEYDGRVTFTATDAESDREYTGTLRSGDRYVDIEVRRGGTYYVEEEAIDGWETSFTDRKGNPERSGDVVTVDDGETAKVYVTNTLIEEEIPEEEPPMVEEPSEEPSEPEEEIIPDEETPIVAPPKTGSAAGSAAALFACAALLGAVVLRKKK